MFLQASLPPAILNWPDILTNLIVQAPMVALLFVLLRQATEERQKTTEQHMAMLREFLTALNNNTSAIKEMTILNTSEHHSTIKAIETLTDAIRNQGRMS